LSRETAKQPVIASKITTFPGAFRQLALPEQGELVAEHALETSQEPRAWTATAGIGGSPVEDEGSLWRVAERTLGAELTTTQLAHVLREMTLASCCAGAARAGARRLCGITRAMRPSFGDGAYGSKEEAEKHCT